MLSAGMTALAWWSLTATGAAAQTATETADASSPAAENNRGDGIETVTVTARHREENAQDVPISLSVVKAATLEANGITNSTKLERRFDKPAQYYASCARPGIECGAHQ